MHYAIIGSSAAGIKAAETIRQLDREAAISVISDESEAPYSRCLIPEYLGGKRTRFELNFRPEFFYTRHGIRNYPGKKVESVEPKNAHIIFEDGRKLSYDKLLIATGASSFFPPIPGLDIGEYYGLRNLKDADNILQKVRRGLKAVVIGGGFVGLEAAYALKERGMDVTVIEMLPQILALQFDETGAGILQREIQTSGIEILTGVGTREIAGPSSRDRVKGNRQQKVILSNGRVLKADLILVSTGTRANTGLVADSGIEVNKGILVNECLETNIKEVYAAGDVCESLDLISGNVSLSPIWPNAIIQGKYAAYNMAGHRKELNRLVGMQNAVEFREIPAIAMGLSKATEEEGYEVLSLYRPVRNIYKKLVLKDNVIKGMLFVGDIENAGVVAALLKKREDVSEYKHKILQKGFNYGYFQAKGA